SEQGKTSINPIADQRATKHLTSGDVIETCRRNRAHDLHSFAAMNEAIAARFVVRETQSVPYCYRYLVPVLPTTSQAASFIDEVFQQESVLGKSGEIVLLGRRMVASI